LDIGGLAHAGVFVQAEHNGLELWGVPSLGDNFDGEIVAGGKTTVWSWFSIRPANPGNAGADAGFLDDGHPDRLQCAAGHFDAPHLPRLEQLRIASVEKRDKPGALTCWARI
jgi:hypothetical protein